MKLMALLLLPSLFSPFVIAKPTCTVNSFQAIDIEPKIETAKYDEKSQTKTVQHQSPMRCAVLLFKQHTH